MVHYLQLFYTADSGISTFELFCCVTENLLSALNITFAFTLQLQEVEVDVYTNKDCKEVLCNILHILSVNGDFQASLLNWYFNLIKYHHSITDKFCGLQEYHFLF